MVQWNELKGNESRDIADREIQTNASQNLCPFYRIYPENTVGRIAEITVNG
jgi:hypothetical protein